MKRTVLLGVGAFLALCCFLIATIPAAQVIYRLALPSDVRIGKVSGSIWQGRVDKLSINGFYIENVKWKVKAASLLVGRLALELKGGEVRDKSAIALSGPVSFSMFDFSKVSASNLTVYLPTDKMIAKVKFPIRVNMGGRFRVRLNELDFGPHCEQLLGRGEWLNASIDFPSGASDLGNFVADLSCQEENIQIKVAEPNSLGLSFTSVLSPDMQTFQVSGQFKVADNLPDEIKQASQFFGTPDSDGYTRFQL
jgi:general secretion pathway protein N